jgi:hypothetical protein
MADCRFCGKPAGWRVDYHKACYEAQAAGRSVEDVRARQAQDVQTATSFPLTAKGVFWAVFGALCLYGLLSGIVAAIIKELG